MAAAEAWCRIIVVGPGGAELISRLLWGHGRPDLVVVDCLARLRLRAAAGGVTVAVRDASTDLVELLDLVGLRRQVEGETERREDVLAVEEAVVPGDPVV